MIYVVVDVNSKCRVRNPRTGRESYSTKAAAEAALTRYCRQAGYTRSMLTVMEGSVYRAQVPMITVTNLMSGKPVQIAADTPWSCNPSSETYWST